MGKDEDLLVSEKILTLRLMKKIFKLFELPFHIRDSLCTDIR